MFQKYTTLPKEIMAVHFTEENKDYVFNSLTGQYAADFEDGKPVIKVKTIHGDTAIVRLGDWIVKEKELGFYSVVKDEVFKASFTLHENNEKVFNYCASISPTNVVLRRFPVLQPPIGCAAWVIWYALDGQWALRIHGQSLEQLAKRGGLSPKEIYLNKYRLPLLTNVSDRDAIELCNKIALI